MRSGNLQLFVDDPTGGEELLDFQSCFKEYAIQWRTQKLFMRGISFSGIWWTFAFGVRCLWRLDLTSYSCFQTNVLARFVDIIWIFFYTDSPSFTCHCTEYKVSALQVRISEENTLNATTKQFITAKISGCVLKQGNNTHWPL